MLSTVRVLPRRVAVVTALVMLTLAWVLGASQLTRAAAAEIDGAITDVNITQTSAGPNQNMRLNLTWAVPDSASSGDTFTLTLPTELDSVTNGFNLRDPDGNIVAVAKVVGQVVTFTLSDYVDTHNDVNGGAWFSVRWDKVNSPTSGPVHLDFTTSTKVFHDTVIKEAGTGTVNRTKPRKVGNWIDPDVNSGSDALRWTIDSPSGPFDKATFTDTVGAGQAINCSSVVYQLGQNLDAAGHAGSFSPLSSAKVISSSCSAGGLTLVAGPILADQIIRIRYLVSITDDSLPSYTNSVAVSVDGTSYGTVSDRVRVQAATGSGTGTTSSSTSPTSTSTTSTSTTTTTTTTTSTTSSSTSPTSTSTTSTTSGATVLPTKLTASPSATVAGLAFTGANIRPLLTTGGFLLVGGLVFLLAGRKPLGSRKH